MPETRPPRRTLRILPFLLAVALIAAACSNAQALDDSPRSETQQLASLIGNEGRAVLAEQALDQLAATLLDGNEADRELGAFIAARSTQLKRASHGRWIEVYVPRAEQTISYLEQVADRYCDITVTLRAQALMPESHTCDTP